MHASLVFYSSAKRTAIDASTNGRGPNRKGTTIGVAIFMAEEVVETIIEEEEAGTTLLVEVVITLLEAAATTLLPVGVATTLLLEGVVTTLAEAVVEVEEADMDAEVAAILVAEEAGTVEEAVGTEITELAAEIAAPHLSTVLF